MSKVSIQTHFPNAVEACDAAMNLFDLIEHNGGRVRRTLLATSFCCDEVCRSKPWLPRQLGAPFTLGGLAGLPFAGRTGMVAFAHHLPDHGAALILYGPHIGFGPDGQPGGVLRVGQVEGSHCCGALQAALARILAGTAPSESLEWDHQMGVVERCLASCAPDLITATVPIVAATEVLYRIIDEQIRALVAATLTEFHGPLVLTAGMVMINTGPDEPDYIDLRDAAVHHTDLHG